MKFTSPLRGVSDHTRPLSTVNGDDGGARRRAEHKFHNWRKRRLDRPREALLAYRLAYMRVYGSGHSKFQRCSLTRNQCPLRYAVDQTCTTAAEVPGTGLEPVRPARGQRGLSSPCLHSTIRAGHGLRRLRIDRSEPIGRLTPNSGRATRCCLILLTSEGASAHGTGHPHLPIAFRATRGAVWGMTEFHRHEGGPPRPLPLYAWQSLSRKRTSGRDGEGREGHREAGSRAVGRQVRWPSGGGLGGCREGVRRASGGCPEGTRGDPRPSLHSPRCHRASPSQV